MGSKAGSASKVKISNFDDLFGGTENTSGEQIIHAKLDDLHTFKGHPFRVLDDEKMEETTESIGKYGVLVPGIVRPRAEGGYEIIAGHRRKRGSEKAGLDTMPVIVRNYTDDEATIIMVDTKVGEIAGEVGQTPSAWNGSIFSMIRNLSENVMIPIAGLIISAILCYELITMVMDKNNMHEMGSEFFFRYLVKACIAVMLLSKTFDITMG